MKTRFNPFMILAAFGTSVFQANAADRYWTGGSTDANAATLWSSTNNIWGATTGQGGTVGTAATQAFASLDNAIFEGAAATVQLGGNITAGTITLNSYTINLDNNSAAAGGGFSLSATNIIGDGTITNSDTTARTVTLAPTADYSGTLNITRTGSGLTNLTVNAASGVTLLASVNGNGSTGNTPNTVTVNSGTLKLRGNNNSATWTVTNVASGATLDLNSFTGNTRTWTIGGTPTTTGGTITNTGGVAASVNTRGSTSGAFLFTSSSASNAISVVLDANRAAFSGAISNDFLNLTTTGATSNGANTNPHIVLANATRIGTSTIGGSGSNGASGNVIAKNAVELLANSATAGNVSLRGSYTTVAATVPTAGRAYSAFIVGGNNSTIGNVAFSNSATSTTGGTSAAVGGNHTAYLKLVGTGTTLGDIAMNNTWTNGTATDIQVSNSRIELLGAAATIGSLSNSTTGTAAPGAKNTKTIILGNPNAAGSASTLTLNTASGATPVFTGVITDATLTPNDTTLGATSTSNAVAATLTNANAIGSLIKTGTGIQSLGGANTYAGGTTVSSGALVFLKTASKPASGSVTVSGTAGLGLSISGAGSFTSSDVDSLWANTLAGVSMNATSLVGIDTSGGDASYSTSQSTRGLLKTGANILTLGGTQTYSGGTTVAGGTLRGDTTSLQGNIVVNSGATLNFDQADTGTFSGAITGAGTVTKTSTGDVTLSGGIGGTNAVNVTAGSLTIDGTNTSTGATTVSAGNLRVNGSLAAASAVSVGGSATLSGTGVVNGTVSAAGTIAPGVTIGTLTTGATTLSSTTVLNYDLDGDDTTIGGAVNDLLTVNGNLTLDGTLNVTGPNFASAVAGDSYRLVNVSGGSITNNGLILGSMPITLPGGLEFAITTSATEVNLVVQAIPSNTYASWLALNAPATGFVTDSDNDGVPNGVENVLGTSPNTYSAGLTQVSATPTSVTYKHKLNSTIASDVTYSYQWSTDLIEWKTTGQTNTGGVSATIVPSAPVSGEVTVVTTVTGGSTIKLFTRLVAGN